ncbi:MAG: gamma-glutamyltransferase [Pseudomonadota bacterium]
MPSSLTISCEKQPASGRGGVVVANHPLGTAAGVEILAAGGNAVDAAVATLLALTVVEPMMVGIAGGGFVHVRSPDGRHSVMDCMSCAPAAAQDDFFTPRFPEDPLSYEVEGRRNQLGGTAVATPGNLDGWCRLHAKLGRLPFADIVEPAIRLAARGFVVTHYLAGAARENEADIAPDAAICEVLRPGGTVISAGDRLMQPDYAESLRLIARDGASAFHGGPLGDALAERAARDGGFLASEDMRQYRSIEREAIFSAYRDYVVVGPPPPASSGIHVAQMLNILESDDLRGLGFGSAETLHLLVEAMRLGFADRRRHGGDPDFVDVPVERLTSKAYAAELRARIGSRAAALPDSAPLAEPNDTTHVTIADKDGYVVSATHTINGIFGARIMVPGTGIIPNNYMLNFDPRPGRALSIVPGKRVPTSMAPMIILKDDALFAALGLPGGLRIFPSAFQAIVNLIDHGMSPQEAVEAPRVWTQGGEVEIERVYGDEAAEALRARGHAVRVMPHIGGGMNMIRFDPNGLMTGAACWRADGVVAALGGGLARPGVRFWPDAAPDEDKDADTAAAKS